MPPLERQAIQTQGELLRIIAPQNLALYFFCRVGNCGAKKSQIAAAASILLAPNVKLYGEHHAFSQIYHTEIIHRSVWRCHFYKFHAILKLQKIICSVHHIHHNSKIGFKLDSIVQHASRARRAIIRCSFDSNREKKKSSPPHCHCRKTMQLHFCVSSPRLPRMRTQSITTAFPSQQSTLGLSSVYGDSRKS